MRVVSVAIVCCETYTCLYRVIKLRSRCSERFSSFCTAYILFKCILWKRTRCI